MDGFKGKRTSSRPVMSRKASGLVLHENMNMKKKDDDDHHHNKKSVVPICSRIGCSSRIGSSTKGVLMIDHKAKSTVSSFRSSLNGKETVGSSSRGMTGFGGTKKALKVTGGRRQLSSLLDMDSSESSSVNNDESPKTERSLPRGKTKESTVSVLSENSVSGEVVVTEAGSSSRGAGRSIYQRPDLVTREARVGNSGQIARATVNRNGLRDLKSKSVSDVVPSNSNPTRKSIVFRKKNSDGESSSSNRWNKTEGSVIGGKNSSSPQGNGITISESRRNRNLQSVRDNSVVSSSARRSTGYYGRTGRAGAVATLQTPRPATRADLNPSRSTEVSRSPLNSYSRPISSDGRLRSLMMPGSPSEAGLSRSLMNRDGFRRYNMNGVAEVLLALERIEQDEELTYEQLAVLETNLFLNGMSSFHDQHRDMRLDIDNMSYEELLALEEKMGTVSTALSEEALLKSLKSSIYLPTDESGDICVNKDDDVKCSICQEEYVDGDEVGTLPCQHKYHVSCAQQWLRMKNWCPICKTSAEESQPQPFS
ncbi:PREDICTED: E3 ubiquitin-protein ligase MBR1-like [Camelina sativa]|uniref:RING-type E3 ubiquitin transferase n=1 Tax=Camelina sativa TaxID=90675 RepID=A0ABM0T5W5_CAMSA|nr:PREDICTED: E3 ubiquitin-protein ligase MBR1-like [Camelina sativa]